MCTGGPKSADPLYHRLPTKSPIKIQLRSKYKIAETVTFTAIIEL